MRVRCYSVVLVLLTLAVAWSTVVEDTVQEKKAVEAAEDAQKPLDKGVQKKAVEAAEDARKPLDKVSQQVNGGGSNAAQELEHKVSILSRENTELRQRLSLSSNLLGDINQASEKSTEKEQSKTAIQTADQTNSNLHTKCRDAEKQCMDVATATQLRTKYLELQDAIDTTSSNKAADKASTDSQKTNPEGNHITWGDATLAGKHGKEALEQIVPIYTGGVTGLIANTAGTIDRPSNVKGGPAKIAGRLAPLQPIVHYAEDGMGCDMCTKSKYANCNPRPNHCALDSTKCAYWKPPKDLIDGLSKTPYSWKGGVLQVNKDEPWQHCMVQASDRWLQATVPNNVFAPENFNAAVHPSASPAVTLNGSTVTFIHDGQRWTAGTTNTGAEGSDKGLMGIKEPAWFPKMYMTNWRLTAKPPYEQLAKVVIQSRILMADIQSGVTTPAVTRTYMTGLYKGYGDDSVPRNIVSVYPWVDREDKQCHLYVYSRSFQIQPECQKKFDATTEARDKNIYFQGCPRGRNFKKGPNPAYKSIKECVPTGGARRCYMASALKNIAALEGYFGFDCCVQVHHHVEKLPCSDPGSHTMSPQDKTPKEQVELLKLGSDSTTVFTSSAMKGPPNTEMYESKPFSASHTPPWVDKAKLGETIGSIGAGSMGSCRGFSPPYYDHLSPQMGMAIDQSSIFVLGGTPLSLRQFARKPGSDGKHALQSTLLERLCLPDCGPDPSHFALTPKCRYETNYTAKTRADFAGNQKPHEGRPNGMGPNGVKWNSVGFGAKDGFANPSVSFIRIANAGPVGHMGLWWDNEVQVNAGGALALHLNKDGIATRVYGVTHCGTVFMAELQKKTVRVLLHLDSPGAKWNNNKRERREVGLALQTYEVPDGVNGDKMRTISKLFISVSAKPFGQRFNQFVPYKSGTASKILKVSVDKLLESKSYKDQKPAKAKWGVKLYPLEETWFPVTTPNPDFDKATKGKDWVKYVQVMGLSNSAQNIHYTNGKLIWYARGSMELRSWSLDIGLPCGALQEALAGALKGWCSEPGSCKQTFPGHVELMEDGAQMPWELIAYRKTATRLTKTSLCARPKRPTTRHSPEQCCVTKSTNPGHEGTPGLEDEIKLL